MSIAAPIITFKAGICDLDVRICGLAEFPTAEQAVEQTARILTDSVFSRPRAARIPSSPSLLPATSIFTPKMTSSISAGALALLR